MPNLDWCYLTGMQKIKVSGVFFVAGVIVGFGLPGLATMVLWAICIGLAVAGLADLVDENSE